MTICEIMKSKNVGRKKYAMVNKTELVSLMIETVVKDKKRVHGKIKPIPVK